MEDALADSDSRIAAAYYCHSDESLSYSGGWVPDERTVFTDREWYTKACEGGIYITEPYIDQVSAQDLREPWTAFHLSEYFKIRLDTLKAAIPPGSYWC